MYNIHWPKEKLSRYSRSVVTYWLRQLFRSPGSGQTCLIECVGDLWKPLEAEDLSRIPYTPY